MSKRRTLPAPPLILTPYLGRFPIRSRRAEVLLALAKFLDKHSLLTDGGSKSLALGLQGRNGVISLGLQDVRSRAHGLVVEALAEPIPSEERWNELLHNYFKRYDRGKPRRPTHLQRLYLDWSRDFSWPGLLDACRLHHRLWPEIEQALERQDDESEDKDLLSLALRCRDDVQPWIEAFVARKLARRGLLRLLPYLSVASADWRVRFLSEVAAELISNDEIEPWSEDLIKATCCTSYEAKKLRGLAFDRGSLESLALLILDQRQEFFEATFLVAFRSFVTRREVIEKVFEVISDDDPLRRVRFGPRPGQSWLGALKTELLEIIALPTSCSSR